MMENTKKCNITARVRRWGKSCRTKGGWARERDPPFGGDGPAPAQGGSGKGESRLA